jgi:hypothetical protein
LEEPDFGQAVWNIDAGIGIRRIVGCKNKEQPQIMRTYMTK